MASSKRWRRTRTGSPEMSCFLNPAPGAHELGPLLKLHFRYQFGGKLTEKKQQVTMSQETVISTLNKGTSVVFTVAVSYNTERFNFAPLVWKCWVQEMLDLQSDVSLFTLNASKHWQSDFRNFICCSLSTQRFGFHPIHTFPPLAIYSKCGV